MRPSLERALIADFPVFFTESGLTARQSCMGRGIACGDGWEPLIRRVAAAAEMIRERRGVVIHATQVKQKFGALRIYHEIAGTYDRDPRFSSIVTAAAAISTRICEVCGQPGRLSVACGRYYRSVCAVHLSRRAIADYEAAHAEPDRPLAEMVRRIGCTDEAEAARIMALSEKYGPSSDYDSAHDYAHLSDTWPTTCDPPAGGERGTPL